MIHAESSPAQLPVVVGFDDVNLAFGSTPALVHVSFSMRAGETRVVLGAAGSGKTMLLKTAVGLVKPDSGHISLFGEEVTGRKESQLYGLRSKVGILFQEGGLFDSLTIAENVAYPLLNQYAVYKNGNALPPDEVDRRVRESLSFVELEHTLDKFPSELSGGMRRRAGIARAIVTAPQLVLYDSPTAGLDPITANLIINLILKGRDIRNTATIMITHRYQDGHLMANFRYNPSSGKIERAESSQLTTRFFVMQEGRLFFEGSEAELRASTDSYVQKFARPGSS
ncbi:MAG TPA: ATP-binding cassette domain-containing protein [Bryobacteraceae bacterium]|nr:ATP-binding cassette domain-containing protein [Bryobacteraceae bacterium]